MEQILTKVKSLASQVTSIDEAVGSRLDAIDRALNEIKTSVTAVKNPLSTLTNQVTGLEKRMAEAESRSSTTKDSYDAYYTRVTDMEKTVALLRLKVDENCGQCKNLKIVGLPEKVEGTTPLVDFLQKLLPTVGLPADFPPLGTDRAHHALVPIPTLDKPPRRVLVQFLHYWKQLRCGMYCDVVQGYFILFGDRVGRVYAAVLFFFFYTVL